MIVNAKKYVYSISRTVKAHCLGWLLFILYDAVLAGVIKGYFGTLPNYLIHYSVNITLFYLTANTILPIAFKYPGQTFWKLPLLICSTLAIYIGFVFCIDSLLVKYTSVLSQKQLQFDKLFVISYAWRGAYFIIFSTGYYFFIQYVKERDQKEIALRQQNEMAIEREINEKKLAQARNAFLLAQINPHFLFNTLNYIYYTTKSNASDGADSILLLSKIMRYTADIENANDIVDLEKEIDYIEALIQIYRLRLKEGLQVQFNYTNEVKHLKSIPLLLITIVENAFKHAHITDHNNPAIIEVGIDKENNLVVISKNKGKALQVPAGLNSGLLNLSDRLEFVYNGKALLNYHTDQAGCFNLKLSVPKIYLI
ncbi:hypothetical protein DU508_11190 [Pedobacter chinensis]|uniref:Signal transduction histidine kinase internal region domain-containing protein n=1 Tax=Pedobacter chinensis TaxID=2282421 RepID=A0A369PUB6_9SPHI|nr:sensor histidine kinase [Pedobacter chinensis]RDC56173.1 hypothetical protein DU508_11190 [Pedobacter chinensis]